MIGNEDIVADVVAAAGDKIVGRIRMQKVFYLLDQLGLNSGFDYEYRHYGPYSADLSEAIEDAKAFAGLQEETHRRQSDGVPYSVFKLVASDRRVMPNIGSLPAATVRNALAKMNRRSATVLELAATIHWLANVERVDDWRSELDNRKGPKTVGGRVSQAEDLLRELEISVC